MKATGPIPVFDLERATTILRDELEERWSGLLETLHFVGGNEVAEFEQKFARFQEVPECVGVANGTDALMLALKALGISVTATYYEAERGNPPKGIRYKAKLVQVKNLELNELKAVDLKEYPYWIEDHTSQDP